MNTEQSDEFSKPHAEGGRPSPNVKQEANPADDKGNPADAGGQAATILVRGETVSNQKSMQSQDASNSDKANAENGKDKRKPIPKEKLEAQSRLPTLADDSDVGVQKVYVVTRDGEADLTFTGTLVASAAPSSALKGQWQEYRIYETNAGKHVFSKITRKLSAEEQDSHEAKVFDPSPSSMPSKLLKTAHDLTHTRPMLWTDAAIEFFGYDPLAKILYQKFGTQFEEHVS